MGLAVYLVMRGGLRRHCLTATHSLRPSAAPRPRPCAVQVESSADIASADRLIFPGVGAVGQAMEILQQRGYTQALKDYIQANPDA